MGASNGLKLGPPMLAKRFSGGGKKSRASWKERTGPEFLEGNMLGGRRRRGEGHRSQEEIDKSCGKPLAGSMAA